MKKLLLSMIIGLITFTATLYAACTSNVDMGNNKIENLATPDNGTDATNKDYVDTKISAGRVEAKFFGTITGSANGYTGLTTPSGQTCADEDNSTFYEANLYATKYGGMLAPNRQALNAAFGTGCGFDLVSVWTTEPCGTNGRMVRAGSSIQEDANNTYCEENLTNTHAVRIVYPQ